jgi:glycosyltransferase involved in cell wall biosynthesis
MAITPDVSIVVPTYNRCAGLERLLRALAAQAYPLSRFEVVVVDDGSTDATSELLRTIETPYVLRSLTQANSGPSVARNQGVQCARGSLILFLDDDVVPVPELVAAHVAAHGDDPDMVVTGPMSPPPSGWPQPAWDRWDALQLQKQYQAMLTGLFSCTQRQFFTANASLRRRMLLEAGGFDPDFKRAEDMELAWRLTRCGARFVFEPRADVVHYAARRFASWRHAAYLYGRYDVLMEREKAIPVFSIACRELHHRHLANRWLTRLCVGRRRLSNITVLGLAGAVHVADSVGADRVASLALSSIFNVQYWQGASDELGGPDRLWQAVAMRGAFRLVKATERAAVETAGVRTGAPNRVMSSEHNDDAYLEAIG